MPEDLVYDFGVESLFRGLGDDFTPELKAKVKTAGIDPAGKLLPAYPRAMWVRVVDVIAQHLCREGNLEAAHRELGVRITEGFAQTALGRVMAPAARLLGVRRALHRLPKNLTITNNFMQATVNELSAESLAVDVSDPVPSAEFLAGSIESVARYAGAKSATVTIEQVGALTRFLVTWT